MKKQEAEKRLQNHFYQKQNMMLAKAERKIAMGMGRGSINHKKFASRGENAPVGIKKMRQSLNKLKEIEIRSN